MSMKILHFADLHLDAAFAWAPLDIAARRRQAIRDTLSEICDVARERRVDLLTCGGDLYEQERFAPDTANFLVATFASLHSIPVLLAPGNHDWLAPSSIYATANWSQNVHIFREDRLSAFELQPGLLIWGAAHRAPANTDNFLSHFHADRNCVNLGLFHASESSGLPSQGEGKQPHASFSADEISRAGLVHALLGHYHTPIDGKDYTYPGNPEPLTFGEIGERGAVLLEVSNDGSITRERIRVSRTVVQQLEVDVSGSASSQEVLDRVAEALAGKTGIARVFVKGDVSPSLSLDPAVLQQVATGLDHVQWLDHIQPAYDLNVIRAEKTIRGQFVRDVEEAASLVEDERRRVLITGLRVLGGREDLEVV
jgi:DNA repair exonuclease SbcCD nuclease subunit